jgi:2-oxoisovalerate dehydrogenase E1 component alpha subunit
MRPATTRRDSRAGAAAGRIEDTTAGNPWSSPRMRSSENVTTRTPARSRRAARGEPETRAAATAPTDDGDGLELVQLLSTEGERIAHPDYPLEVSAEEARSLYRDLVLVRRVDTEGTALQRQGELGLWASLLGQEAAQVGSGRAMRPGDFAFPTYREHGVAWCRGVPPVNLLGMFRGVNNGGWDPAEKNFNLYTIVIGSQTLHAVGYAMGIQRDGSDDAVIAYFGDGASSQGDVNEAFVFAASYNAPVVFFCQNNQWAISEPTERQSRVPLYRRASGFGFPGIRVDGNDVFACLAVTRAALERARTGNGPTLIEAYTYRMGAHTTSDDPTRYRGNDEVELWRSRDPIQRLRKYLDREGAADEAFFAGIEAEADELATEVRAACLALPDPAPLSMFDYAYSAPHHQVTAEREQLSEYLAGFGDQEAAR